MTKKELALIVIDLLKKEYPDSGCSLEYEEPWKLLVSVRLAAQCTDARVNIITKTPTKPLEGSIDVSFGSFNTQNAKVYVGGLQNNILYEVAANKITSDGHLENSQYNATDVYEKLGYVFNDGSTLIFEAKQFQGVKHEPEARTKDGGKIYGKIQKR